MALHLVDPESPGIERRAGRGVQLPVGARSDHPGQTGPAEDQGARHPARVEEVWICSDPDGHIQAVGVDDRGRRQYRYHPEWVRTRRREARARAAAGQAAADAARTGERGPRARRDAEGSWCSRAPSASSSCGVFRIGGEAYAEQNGELGWPRSSGATCGSGVDTVEFGSRARGQRRRVRVLDPGVRSVVLALRRRRAGPDEELLAYRDGDGAWVDVRSADINEYLHGALGEEHSAKDFEAGSGPCTRRCSSPRRQRRPRRRMGLGRSGAGARR